MDDSADVVQQVLAAAAEDSGEFDLPLSAERIKAMRAALVERRQLVLFPLQCTHVPVVWCGVFALVRADERRRACGLSWHAMA